MFKTRIFAIPKRPESNSKLERAYTTLHTSFTFIYNLQAIMKHFKTLTVKEKETLTYFIYMVKTNSNKLDQKNGINNNDTM